MLKTNFAAGKTSNQNKNCVCVCVRACVCVKGSEMTVGQIVDHKIYYISVSVKELQ